MRKNVIAIFDVGKTNKKLFLFDEDYQIVYEKSARFLETEDEDGDPCENLESLRLSVFDSLHEVFRREEFFIKAINFTSYGASFVYLDESGRPLTPLYNYLKEYPVAIQEELYKKCGGVENFSLETASPALGSLNSGLQILRLKKQKPEVFEKIKTALHLPQYLSFLVSGKLYSDRTSIGCHTALWDFTKNNYHQWVLDEELDRILAPISQGDVVYPAAFPGATYTVGVGLHDSSSALIPYLLNFHEPFILISTGTWCISFNPFNDSQLTKDQLEKDTLFYLTYAGTPVKASRLFAGQEHETQAKRIANHFQVAAVKFRSMTMNDDLITEIKNKHSFEDQSLASFSQRPMESFSSYEEAYHVLMMDLVLAQVASTKNVMNEVAIKRIFVDGGFSKNQLYMNLLAQFFADTEIFAASMAQATAIGAALVIHPHWNSKPIPHDLIELKYFRA